MAKGCFSVCATLRVQLHSFYCRFPVVLSQLISPCSGVSVPFTCGFMQNRLGRVYIGRAGDFWGVGDISISNSHKQKAIYVLKGHWFQSGCERDLIEVTHAIRSRFAIFICKQVKWPFILLRVFLLLFVEISVICYPLNGRHERGNMQVAINHSNFLVHFALTDFAADRVITTRDWHTTIFARIFCVCSFWGGKFPCAKWMWWHSSALNDGSTKNISWFSTN